MAAQDSKLEDLAKHEIKRYNELVGGRSVLDQHLQEVAERVLPSYSHQFIDRNSSWFNKGDKRTDLMFDATAANALQKFAAIVEALSTPRTTRWHRLSTTDRVLKANRAVRQWFENVTDILFDYRYAAQSSFASQKEEDYLQLGAFGTGNIFTDSKRDQRGMRYRSCSIGDTYFTANHEGVIDEVHRRLMLSARQAVQKFGMDNLPEQITAVLEKTPDREFEFIHCVKPREDMDPQRKDYRGMKYASYYISKLGQKVVEQGGYRTFPFSISRATVAPGEIYGRSPAMMVLPNIKTLNELKKTMLKQGHRATDPTLLAYDDGVLSTRLIPGEINYGGVSQDGRALVHALPSGNIAVGKDAQKEERDTIKDAFFVTLFEILIQDRRDMTAAEVFERAKEKGIFLSPTASRLQEALSVQIDRELDILASQGRLPPMPPILAQAQGEYKVQYDNEMSRMMHSQEASGFLRSLEFSLKLAVEARDPSSLDHYNLDVATPEIAEINGAPLRWMRSLEEIAAIREGRNAEADQQKLIAAAPGIASVIKSIGPAAASPVSPA